MPDFISHRSNLFIVIGLALCLLVSGGCGKDDPQSSKTPPGQNIVPDIKDPNKPPSDRPPGLETGDASCGECSDGRICKRGVCALDSCANAQDLGVLSLDGGTISVSGNNNGADAILNTTCAARQHPLAREKIYKFRVPSPALMSTTLTSTSGVDWIFEVRKEQCYDANSAELNAEILRQSGMSVGEFLNAEQMKNTVGCFRQENVAHSFALEPGIDHFLVVKPSVMGTGEFELNIDLKPLVCQPDSRQCHGSDRMALNICSNSGIEKNKNACGTPCLQKACDGNDCCAGDSCQASLDISLTDSNPVYTLQGNLFGFTNTLDFREIGLLPQPGNRAAVACNQGSIPTTGSDMVIQLRNVQQGETIVFDTVNNDPNNNNIPANRNMTALYILSDCPEQARQQVECLGYSAKASPYKWTAPTSGNFYVVIDTRIMAHNDYIYRICKGDCPIFER